MMNIRIGIWIVFLVVGACSPREDTAKTRPVVTDTAIPAYEIFQVGQEGFPKISAHRGGRDIPGYPENCLETFQYVHERTLALIECDVAMTADDEIILMHDDGLERTTTGEGPVDRLTYKQIRALYLVDDFGKTTTFKVPSLRSVLKWGKDAGVYFTIDFKKSVPYEGVIALIEAEQMLNQCILISYSAPQAEKLHRLSPNSMISVSMRNNEELERMLETNVAVDRMIAFTGTRRKDGTALFDRIHDLGILCMFGSLGNIDRQAANRGDEVYIELFQQGVDILATDRPMAVFELLD